MSKNYNKRIPKLLWKKLYINLGELGHGGNSKVYKVIKKTDETKKAIALKDPGYLNKIKRKRFLNEIKIVVNEQTNFDGILPIIEYSKPEDKYYWYTMPIAIPAKEALKDCSEDKIISAILEIATTLKMLHAKKIFHRDIKPENLFYYNKKFCIGDFGLVHFPKSEQLTKNNKSLGPWATMAPEMRREPKNYDGEKADVYSLAKTLWILLCGRDTCFDGVYDYNDSTIALDDKKFKNSIVDIHLLLKDCTQHDPLLRPTMVDFVQKLESWLKNKDNDILNQAKEWNFIKNQLFIVPASTIRWTHLDDIVKVLTHVTKRKNLNHMLLPTGGGIDAEEIRLAYEKGSIFIYNIGSTIELKPKALYMECFKKPIYNYFLLDADTIKPIQNGETEKELCAALPNGTHLISDGIIYGKYAYDSDEDLPQDTIIVERYLKGKFLFVFKMYGYNSIGATYDGRHNYATPEEFREYMEIIASTQRMYRQVDSNLRETLDKFYSINIFNPTKKNEINKVYANTNDINIEDFVLKNFLQWDFSSCIKDAINSENSPVKYYLEFDYMRGHFSAFQRKVFGPHRYLCKDGKIKEFNDVKNILDLKNEVLFTDTRDTCERIAKNCENLIQEIFSSSVKIKHNGLFFDKEFIRNQDIKPQHLFDRAEILTKIRNADDRQDNSLVIDENGFIQIIQDYKENVFLFPVRNSQWDAGNNYVGRHANLDEKYINDVYMYCLNAWLSYLDTGKIQYLNEFDINYDEESLIKSIKTFY